MGAMFAVALLLTTSTDQAIAENARSGYARLISARLPRILRTSSDKSLTDHVTSSIPRGVVQHSKDDVVSDIFRISEHLQAPSKCEGVVDRREDRGAKSSAGASRNSFVVANMTGLSAAGTILTYAGTGLKGYKGDNMLAKDCELSEVSCVAISPLTGNLYIADAASFVVRMVTKSTRVITTVAGTGVRGYDGDGGLATAAELDLVSSVAIDSTTGDIYIVDNGNNVIRMVTSSDGIINTIAGTGAGSFSGDGGLALNATFNNPAGCALDPSTGDLYIADTKNNVIRMITKKTGIISTIAGIPGSEAAYTGDGGPATAAGLGLPSSVTVVSPSGDLYIADTGNHVIRMYMKSTGVISTIAGTGIKGYSGDGGPASSAQLNAPNGVTIDKVSDNVFISDTDNFVIRMIEKSTGIITTIAGNGKDANIGDGGLAVNASMKLPVSVAIDTAANAIYIADSKSYVVRSVIGSTQSPAAAPTAATPSSVGTTFPPLSTTGTGSPSSSPATVRETLPPTEVVGADSTAPTPEGAIEAPTAATPTQISEPSLMPTRKTTPPPTNRGAIGSPTATPITAAVTGRPSSAPSGISVIGGPSVAPTIATSSAPRVPSTRNPASPVRPYTTKLPTAEPTVVVNRNAVFIEPSQRSAYSAGIIAIIVGASGAVACMVLLCCLLYFCHYKPLSDERKKECEQQPTNPVIDAELSEQPVC